MLGHTFTKSNQIKSIKDLSTNLKNIFRLNHNKSEFNFRYHTEKTFNKLTSNMQKSNLSIFCLNIRSLSAHHMELDSFLKELTFKFDFICLTEIWNTNMTFLTNIFEDYKCQYAAPKSSNCGGVAIFYRKNYKIEILKDLSINSLTDNAIDVDELWLDAETENGSKCTIGTIYRHPKSNLNQFNDRLCAVLEKINSNKLIDTCFVAGDFNANLINYDNHNPTETFLNNFISNSFLPCIHLPTRITYKSATLIDNIFIFQRKAKKAQNIVSGSFYSDISDHLPCFAVLNYPSKIPRQTRPKIRVYNEASKQNFLRDLKQVDWTPVYVDNDPNSSFDKFYGTFKKLHNKHFPLQTLSRRKSKQSPWMTKELNKMRKVRDTNRIKVNKGLLDEKEYKRHKNKLRKMMRQAQESYYTKLFDEKQNGMKKMWNHLGCMLNPKRSKGPQMIKRLCIDGKNVTENLEISEMLNQHFCSIGNKLAARIPKSIKSFKHFMKSPLTNSMFFDKLDQKDVLSIIETLNSNKSPGLDGIGNNVLKISAEAIIGPLTHILNNSITKGIFPECLKTAKVIPLFKKGDESLCSNYRPISLLSCFHKLFEKIIKEKLLDFLYRNNVLYKYQFGFKKKNILPT